MTKEVVECLFVVGYGAAMNEPIFSANQVLGVVIDWEIKAKAAALTRETINLIVLKII